MSNLIFHNNFHRSNHHTVALSGYPESSKDPIASIKFPFKGVFYNDLYTIDGNFISKTNSYDWYSAYTTTNSNSGKWEQYLTTYTTVCSNSAFWDEFSKVYSELNAVSGNWQSTFDTLCANIVYWNAVYDPTTMYTNQVQESTRQKTFKNYLINPEDPMDIILNLSAGQVSTYYAETDSKFNGFTGAKRGGIYHLILILDSTSNPNFEVYFDFDKFKFSNNQNNYVINSASNLITFENNDKIIKFGSGDPIVREFVGERYLRKFQFFYDGERLHGKSLLYDLPLFDKQLITIIDQFIVKNIDGENLHLI
jgi:hypothetical protein